MFSWSGTVPACLPNGGGFLPASVSSLCPLSLLAARRPIYHRPSSLWSETYGEHYPSAPHIPHFPTLLCLADVTFKRGPFVSHKYITNGLTRKKHIKTKHTHLALSPINRSQVLSELLSQSEVHVKVLKGGDGLNLHFARVRIVFDMLAGFQNADDFP